VQRSFKSWLLNSTVSAEDPPEDADDLEAIAKLQGYDDWRNCAPNSRIPKYKLMPHQIVDANFMLQSEKHAYKGSIIGHSVSTGKTNIIFNLIAAAAKEINRNIKENPDASHGLFYPTLVLASTANFSQM